jgi:hypothetical protein
MDDPVNPRREGKMSNTASAGPHVERSLVTRSKKFAKGEMHASKLYLSSIVSRAARPKGVNAAGSASTFAGARTCTIDAAGDSKCSSRASARRHNDQRATRPGYDHRRCAMHEP